MHTHNQHSEWIQSESSHFFLCISLYLTKFIVFGGGNRSIAWNEPSPPTFDQNIHVNRIGTVDTSIAHDRTSTLFKMITLRTSIEKIMRCVRCSDNSSHRHSCSSGVHCKNLHSCTGQKSQNKFDARWSGGYFLLLSNVGISWTDRQVSSYGKFCTSWSWKTRPNN